MSQLSQWDYVVIGGYLIAVVVIGVLFSRRQKSLKEYFLASGSVPWWAVSISMHATALSPLSFLGIAGWIFLKDSRYIIIPAFIGIATAIGAAYLWVPLWSRLQLQSIYEYLERRYHPVVRTFGSALFPVTMVFWIGNGLVAAAMGFEAATGVQAWQCILGIVVLGTIYTMLGGARAVIWTDVAQFIVFMFAYILIGGILLNYFDWQPMRVYDIASSVISEKTGYPHTKILSAEFSLSIESTIWALIFARGMLILTAGTQQVYVQRMMAAGTRSKMFKAKVGSASFAALDVLLAAFVAWGLVAFYHDNPGIRATMEHPDQVMAHYVVGYVPMLVRGVIMAGLLAAMMSTFDSALNSMSSVTINDFYKRYIVRDRSEHHYVSSSRYFTLGWGVVILLFALWQLNHSDSVALERSARLKLLLSAPLLCFFVMGLFFKRTNTLGVLIGGLSGIGVALAFNGFPGLFEKWVSFDLNWMWISGFSTLVSFVVAYLASFLFPKPPAEKLKGLTIRQKDA